ncbi:SDR family NAD(P)-dependent oxidoreductase [Rapidithrix thailandica]|uniref:SDR family NAD(P)-dependent oxidoreductase n=1 Tax=Rapidithrix thailandica TaxID=413964 RepID=A0AAW9SGJ7_9BACT
MTTNKWNHYILVISYQSDFVRKLRQWAQTPVVEVEPGLEFEQKGEKKYGVPPTEEGFSRLFETLGGVPDILINYHVLDEAGWNVAKTNQLLENTYHQSLNLVKAIIKQKPSNVVKWLYSYSYTPENSFLRPFYSAVNGLIRTLHIEFPAVHGLCVELNNPTEYKTNVVAADAEIITECLEQEWDRKLTELRYHNGQKHQRRLTKVKELEGDKATASLRNEGVYLITGGLGGIGAIISKYLANQLSRPTLILTGRTALDQERNDALNTLRSTNAKVEYIQADVTAEEQVEQILGEVKKQYGGLNGIIHCAGILKDNFIIKKSKVESNEVIAPKVYGTMLLDDYTAQEPLDFFLLFSSISGVMGNLGQVDYAYANSFLNNFSEERNALQKQGLRQGKTVAISWPLWSNGGMKLDQTHLDSLKSNLGMVPITDQEGVAIFEKALQSNVSQFMVMKGQAEKIAQLVNPTNASLESKFEQSNRNSTASENELAKHTKDYMKQLVAEITELPVHKIKETASFEKFGIDSFAIMKLNNELEKTFGELSKTLFFEYQNIEDLVAYLLEDHHEVLKNKFNLKENSGEQPKDNGDANTMSGGHLTKTVEVNSISQPVSKKPFETESGDIAIVGLSGSFPGADSLQEFWFNICEGKNCITEIPSDRWMANGEFYDADRNAEGKSYTKWGGFIKDIDRFDPLFFNISPAEAELMDPQERLLLQTVWAVIEDAGYTPEKLGTGVGVFMGSMYKHYHLAASQASEKALLSSTSYWSLVNRLSYFFDFQGPSIAIDTACASSLTAVYMACHSIWRGECEASIAGGVNLSMHPDKYIGLSTTNMIGSTDRSKSFGQGDGYVPGEGVGAVLLKPLHKATADKDHIYGVIKAVGANHSGKTSGFSVPGLHAQKNLIVKTVEQSGCPAETIRYIESAANGSPFGDAIEVNAISKAFGRLTSKKAYCAIGTVKSNIGHLEAASGISQLVKVLLQMKHGKLVPTINAETLNENITLHNTPLYLQKELADWDRLEAVNNDGTVKVIPRRAAINSFGAGGSNVHLIVEENLHEPIVERTDAKPFIIVLSAKRREALKTIANNLLEHLENESQISLANIAFTLMHGRCHFEYRLALVVSDKEELQHRLKQIASDDMEMSGCFSGKVEDDKEEELNRLMSGDEILSAWLHDNRYDKIADAWVQGVNLNFSQLPQSKVGRRVALPTYPFDKKLCWVGATRTGSQSKNSHEAIGRDTSLKTTVKGILSQIFKLTNDEIDDKKNLTRYGMDSLSGMRFINKIQEIYDLKLSARVLLQHPTVDSFCKLLEDKLKVPPQKKTHESREEKAVPEGLEQLFQQLYKGEISADEALTKS